MQWVSIVIVAIMVCFSIVGIVDTVFCKDKLGLGPEFKKGIELIGPLCLSIVGIISFAPVISWAIEHSLGLLYGKIGLDPSMAVSMILAMDMGGYQVSMGVATDPLIGTWAGTVYGSMMGATIVFSIPVGLAAIQKKDIAVFAKGILFGIAAIPVGTFIGGLVLGVPVVTVLINLIVPVIFSAVIILCLAFIPNGTIKVFKWFSIFINAFSLLAFALAMVKDLILSPISATGAFDIEQVAFFNLIAPTADGIGVAGAVGLVLSGALPLVYCLNKALKKPLSKLSAKTGFTEMGALGFLLSAANNMATFSVLDQMKDREKILNVAWAVCGAFIIGDHLAFVAGMAPSAIVAMMVSKLVAGIIAVAIAVLFTTDFKKKKRAPIAAAEGSAESVLEDERVETPSEEKIQNSGSEESEEKIGNTEEKNREAQ